MRAPQEFVTPGYYPEAGGFSVMSPLEYRIYVGYSATFAVGAVGVCASLLTFKPSGAMASVGLSAVSLAGSCITERVTRRRTELGTVQESLPNN